MGRERETPTGSRSAPARFASRKSSKNHVCEFPAWCASGVPWRVSLLVSLVITLHYIALYLKIIPQTRPGRLSTAMSAGHTANQSTAPTAASAAPVWK